MSDKKIIHLEKLVNLVKNYKKKGKKIVLCHGVFDLLHLGHIKHFEEAKKYGDILIVTVTPDKYVNKGANRPVFLLQQRMEALSALNVIDFVAPNKWKSAIETIKILEPNIYCKGPDYKNNDLDYTKKIHEEKRTVKAIGGNIEYTSKTTVFSSSNILNKFSDIYTDKQNNCYKYNAKEVKCPKDKNKIKEHPLVIK